MDNKQAYKILGNISIDYSDLSQEQADQMDEALDHAFRALAQVIKQEDQMKRWRASIKAEEEDHEEIRDTESE